ncbi:hypothetical protein [Facklamia sp. P9177]|uniref:hypothetical protein n=1 Tax=Facklamia sp. P9177 TaxID=3421945 RepID=UPI003D176302
MKGASYEVYYNRRSALSKKVVEYAIKYNNNAAARRYHMSRHNVKRWRDRYNGNRDSLRLKSPRPHSHSANYQAEELELVRRNYQRYGHEGLAEVYVQCRRKDYKRSYDSMCKQIRQKGWNCVQKGAILRQNGGEQELLNLDKKYKLI